MRYHERLGAVTRYQDHREDAYEGIEEYNTPPRPCFLTRTRRHRNVERLAHSLDFAGLYKNIISDSFSVG